MLYGCGGRIRKGVCHESEGKFMFDVQVAAIIFSGLYLHMNYVLTPGFREFELQDKCQLKIF